MNFELKHRKVTDFLKFGMILLLFPLGVFAQGNGLYEFRGNDGKYGFIDKTGKIIIKPKYHIVCYPGFSEGLVFVAETKDMNGDFKWICIDTTGKTVFELDNNCDPEESFNEGYAVISNWKTETYWFVDKSGDKVFNKKFVDASEFTNGYAIVSNKNKNDSDSYFIDRNGKQARHLPCNCSVFINGISFCHKQLIDTLGNVLIDSIDEWTGNDYEYLKVKRNGKWGFVDQKGNIIIDFIYTEDRNRNFDYIFHLNSDSLDALPKEPYRNVGFFIEGFASIMKDSLFGFINTKNEIVIEPIFKGVQYFSEGLAGATIDGILWGFINTKGGFVIQPQFYYVDAFEHGICGVLLEKRENILIIGDYRLDAIINKNGEILSKYEMHSYMGFQGDFIQFYDYGDFGGRIHYLDENGVLVTPIE